MQMRLADFIANFLVTHGIHDCFTVTGGGAMYLNDAFGHKEGLHCTYQHHEQACAMAAEAYYRIHNQLPLVCVTTGPGGTNTLTGVLGGWLNSVPMLIISGQVRYDTTTHYHEQFTDGLPLRAVGDQEFPITKTAATMCKYTHMLLDPNDIQYVLEKAIHLATTGRGGPSWIDIPLNLQNTTIETDTLRHYDPNEDDTIPSVDPSTFSYIVEKIKNAKRPVLYVGNEVRLAGGYEAFRKLVELLNIPVCTFWDSIDMIETEHPLYVGRGGNMGDRPGNFAVQNADVILALGNRLSIRVIGYNWDTWAREAEIIMVYPDEAELKKGNIHVEYPIYADLKVFTEGLVAYLETPLLPKENWVHACANWKEKYPVVPASLYEEKGLLNPYVVFDCLSRLLPEHSLTVTSNGTCCVAGHQTWFIKEGTRFINNDAVASMGFGLPGAIGACLAHNKQTTICLEGDGSIMMNLQELQTIVTNNLPIKVLLINNEGYHSIRQTQTNIFPNHSKVGIGEESHDLSFPDFKKVMDAFQIPYYEIHDMDSLESTIQKWLNSPSYGVLEAFVSKDVFFAPRNAAKVLPDGTLFSPPLEDLAPFLSKEELDENMFIDLVEK